MLRLPPSVKSRLRKRPGARNDQDAADFEAFVQMAAPGLYLSTAVAAELRAGTIQARDIRTLEKIVLKPYYKRARIVNPSAAAWDALGKTLPGWSGMTALTFEQSAEVSSSISCLPIQTVNWEPF